MSNESNAPDVAPAPAPALPITFPAPTTPAGRRRARAGRIAAYVLAVAAIVVPIIQFQHKTTRNLDKLDTFERQLAAGQAQPHQRPKSHKGAIGRWRFAVRQFWAGRNIYLAPDAEEFIEDARAWREDPTDFPPVIMHPNMPIVVILLSPFAYLSVPTMALTFSLAKAGAILASLWMVARIVNHRTHRMGDWVLGLGLAWGVLFIVGDMQHGNTNVFVMTAVVAHLYLYRRGHDLAAGGVLALAICLKMTPALFGLYWLYQRNWKLLGGSLLGGLLLAIGIPAVAVGPGRLAELLGAWLDNLILPGLLEGAWYPIHVNQSLPGVASRYFLDGHAGNIYWNPDDNPASMQKEFGYIHLVVLQPGTVKLIIRAGQLLVMGLLAWAIGWRKRPRDDGRRALHFGLVTLGMMILNQRTWDHHATVLLVAHVAIWYALAYGRLRPAVRISALVLTLLAGSAVWASGEGTLHVIARLTGHPEEAVEDWSDRVKAYGPVFYHFVLLLVTGVVLSVALRKRDQPYASVRQPVMQGPN